MSAWSSFVNWLRNGGESEAYSGLSNSGIPEEKSTDSTTLNLKMITIASALGYLTNALSMCDWQVIRKGKTVKNRQYYRLNNAPNPNQNKQEFCQDIIWKLCMENECLIFQYGKGLYVADSYTEEKNGLSANVYRDITVLDSDIRLTRTADSVMHLKMNWIGLWPFLNQLAEEYETMIGVACFGYERQTSEKGILNISGAGAGTERDQKYRDQLIQNAFKKFLGSKSAVLPLRAGYSYTPHSTSSRNTSEMNDLVNLTDEYSERVGLAVHVPPSLLKGDVENTEHARVDLMTYGVAPIANQIEQELNMKILGWSGMEAGDRFVIDNTPVLLCTPTDIAAFAEKMTSCGQCSIDEIREMRRVPLLGTPEAQKHYITKNYGILDESGGVDPSTAVDAGKDGGEKTE